MSEDSQEKLIKGFQIPYPEFDTIPEVKIKGDVVKVPGTEGKPSIVVITQDGKNDN
jgi:hypothetical protein